MPDASEAALRRQILDATRHLLVRHGYAALSMRKIARAVGCSATSIYLYFENKDALFHALIDEGFERLHAVMTAVDAEADDPLARLEAMCRAYVAFGLDNGEYYEVMFLLHPEKTARFPVEKYRRARRSLDVFAQALREGAAAGVLEVADARVSAGAVWGALHGTVSLLLAERVDVRIDRGAFVATAIRQVLRGYTRAAAPAPG